MPYLISLYIPITLFTWSSFSSFDMTPDSGGDRMGFLITLFMVIVAMITSTSNQSPGGNVVTSIGNYFQWEAKGGAGWEEERSKYFQNGIVSSVCS